MGRLAPLVGSVHGIRWQRERGRLASVVEDGRDDRAVLVDGACRRARCADRRQQLVYLPRRDLRGRTVTECGHDVSERLAFAPLARQSRLAQHRFSVSQRGGLGACHICQPAHVGVGDLAEGHAAGTALLLDALCIRRFGDMRGNQMGGSHDRGAFVKGTLGYPAAPPNPGARFRVTVEPRGADAPLDLAPEMPKLRLVEGLAAVLADDDVGVWFRFWYGLCART